MIISKFLFLSLVPMILGANRIAIDKVSCSGDLYDKVKFYLLASLARAELSANQLGPYTEDAATPPNQRIMGQLTRIFGANDNSVALQLYTTYNAIRQYHFDDADVWSNDWKNDRDMFDVQIHCNADHIKPYSHVESNINWKDEVQGLPVYDDSAILDFKDPETGTLGVTCPARTRRGKWPPKSPEIIAFEPGYIKSVVEHNIMFNSDIIKKALHPSLLDRIRRRIRREDPTQADLLVTPDFTLFHELTHLMVPGDSHDRGGDDGYGWRGSLRQQQVDHADGLAFFALAVDLIMNHEYDIDDNGTLQSFTNLR